MVKLNVPTSSRLPDNDQWTNRFKIKSSSSNRVYIVAQNKSKQHFGCSCPGWIYHRNCKHLQALGLPGNSIPVQVQMVNPAPAIEFAEANA
jgi:hypothetical protein